MSHPYRGVFQSGEAYQTTFGRVIVVTLVYHEDHGNTVHLRIDGDDRPAYVSEWLLRRLIQEPSPVTA